MKAEELRINNIIYLTKDNFKSVKEYTLTGFDIYKLEDNDCADIKPIPLTEEWLLKFGFEVKVGGRFGNEYHLDNFILYTSEKESICFVWDEFILDIYFVHDLQNLYNCLKRKELTIKTK